MSEVRAFALDWLIGQLLVALVWVLVWILVPPASIDNGRADTDPTGTFIVIIAFSTIAVIGGGLIAGLLEHERGSRRLLVLMLSLGVASFGLVTVYLDYMFCTEEPAATCAPPVPDRWAGLAGVEISLAASLGVALSVVAVRTLSRRIRRRSSPQ